MKRIIAFILICIFALSLCACENDTSIKETSKMDIVYPDTSFDTVSTVYIEDPDGSDGEENVSDIVIMGGFEVKEKKYHFHNTDHVILFTENKTDKNYTVTVTGTYYDEKGTPLKTEQHTFVGFAAGYENCFLFSPNMTFDSFKYTIDAVKYDGECYAPHVEMKFSELRECRWPLPQITDDHMTYYPQVDTSLYYYSDYDANLSIGAVVAVFDDKGNMAYLATCGKAYIPPMSNTASGGLVLYYELTEGEMQHCPQWIKNKDFTMAVILLAVSTEDSEVPIPLNVYPHLSQWYKEE